MRSRFQHLPNIWLRLSGLSGKLRADNFTFTIFAFPMDNDKVFCGSRENVVEILERKVSHSSAVPNWNALPTSAAEDIFESRRLFFATNVHLKKIVRKGLRHSERSLNKILSVITVYLTTGKPDDVMKSDKFMLDGMFVWFDWNCSCRRELFICLLLGGISILNKHIWEIDFSYVAAKSFSVDLGWLCVYKSNIKA